MNETQWAFEDAAIQRNEERRYDEMKAIMDAVRDEVISVLGVNLMPVEDPHTGLLRLPQEGEYLPLMLGMGREDVVAGILKKQGEYHTQEQVRQDLEVEGSEFVTDRESEPELTPEELEAFMAEGDIQFDNEPDELQESLSWGDPMMQKMLESLVVSKEDLDAEQIDLMPRRARTIGQARRELREEAKRKKDVGETEEIPVRIESEGSLDEIPAKRKRSRVVIETD